MKTSPLQVLVFVPSLLSAGITGCSFEEDPAGYGCRVEIAFNFLPASEELPGYGIDPAEVKNLRLFVFDSEDVLVYSDYRWNIDFNSAYTMEVNRLQPGSYRFVAWGNHPACYDIAPEPEIGRTRYQELRMSVASLVDNVAWMEIDPLFYCCHTPRNYEITPGKKVQRVVLDVTRDTHDLHIILRGYPVNGEKVYLTVVSDDNGTFYFDNRYAPGDTIHYVGTAIHLGADGLHARIRMLKTGKYRDPKLSLIDYTNRKILFTTELLPLIMMLEEVGCAPDLDNLYTYTIESVRSSDGEVSVSVNGYLFAGLRGQVEAILGI